MTVSISSALGDVRRYFEELPEIATRAATLAVNQVAARDGLSLAKREMRAQIDFPNGYLEQGRLGVTRKATTVSIEAVITGRDRPTSLARFAAGQTPENTRGRGVRVRVKKGRTKLLRGAFMVRLKNGNLGVAVRLKPGERLENSQAAKRLSDNVYLLYGPSVEQVFAGVADDALPDINRMLSNQFLRQFARLSRG